MGRGQGWRWKRACAIGYDLGPGHSVNAISAGGPIKTLAARAVAGRATCVKRMPEARAAET